MIKQATCVKFDYDSMRADQDMVLESSCQFAVQRPRDPNLPERAILVHFTARGNEEKFKLVCVCRVIFTLDSREALPEDQDFLHLHAAEAYAAMQEITNDVLYGMNQKEMTFPPLD